MKRKTLRRKNATAQARRPQPWDPTRARATLRQIDTGVEVGPGAGAAVGAGADRRAQARHTHLATPGVAVAAAVAVDAGIMAPVMERALREGVDAAGAVAVNNAAPGRRCMYEYYEL